MDDFVAIALQQAATSTSAREVEPQLRLTRRVASICAESVKKQIVCACVIRGCVCVAALIFPAMNVICSGFTDRNVQTHVDSLLKQTEPQFWDFPCKMSLQMLKVLDLIINSSPDEAARLLLY